MNLLRRVAWWWNRQARQDDLALELAHHEELKRAALEQDGMPPAEAARRARRELGPQAFMREEARAVWVWPWLDRLGQDIRYAFRTARRTPAYALGFVTVMGLGIGAVSTIFSVVDGVILKPLPYPASARLVFFQNGSHSPPRFRDWQRALPFFEKWAAAWGEQVDLIGDGVPERLFASKVSPDFFEVFGGRAATGRLINSGDHEAGGAVAVLSDRFWRRRYGADPAVIGRTIDLGGDRVVVVGVLDHRFVEPDEIVSRAVDVWRPLALSPDLAADPRYSILDVAARAVPGMTLGQVRTAYAAAALRLLALDPRVHGDGEGKPADVPIVSLKAATARGMSRPLGILLGAVGLMLLIACANVINLSLARGSDRAREMAVRASLGAGRARLARQLVTETLTLGLLAGGLGLLVATVGVRLLVGAYPGRLPRAGELGVDVRVVAVTLALSMVAAVVAGLAPASALRGRWLHDTIKSGGAAASPDRRRSRHGLIVAEVALALLLLVGSSLFFRSFLQLIRVDPGFDPTNVGVATLVLGDRFSAERRLTFARSLVERVRQVPGVVDASIGVPAPMARFGGSRCCWAHNQLVLDDGREVEQRVLLHPTGARYFETIGAVVRGGTIDESGRAGQPYPAVVSEALAAAVYPGVEPIGRQLTVGRGEGAKHFRIVGVVAALRQFGLDQDAETELFAPFGELGGDFDEQHLVFRTSGDPGAVFPAIRAAALEIDPTVPTDDIQTMRQYLDRSVAQPRFYRLLMVVFGAMALVLAVVGIHASMLYSVRQRRREMGIRSALGAAPGAIAGLVVGQIGRLALVGTVLGGAAAWGLTRFARGLLFGISPADPVAFVAAASIIGAAALAAGYLPARQASRADPLAVLRAD